MKGYEVTRWPETIVFIGQGEPTVEFIRTGFNIPPMEGRKVAFRALGAVFPEGHDKTDTGLLTDVLQVRKSVTDVLKTNALNEGTGVEGPFLVELFNTGICLISTPDREGVDVVCQLKIKNAKWEHDTVLMRWILERA